MRIENTSRNTGEKAEAIRNETLKLPSLLLLLEENVEVITSLGQQAFGTLEETKKV